MCVRAVRVSVRASSQVLLAPHIPQWKLFRARIVHVVVFALAICTRAIAIMRRWLPRAATADIVASAGTS